jgi:hypothetical protein
MFFYTITKLFITLLENVNKSRTSAGRLSLNMELKARIEVKYISIRAPAVQLAQVVADSLAN